MHQTRLTSRSSWSSKRFLTSLIASCTIWNSSSECFFESAYTMMIWMKRTRWNAKSLLNMRSETTQTSKNWRRRKLIKYRKIFLIWWTITILNTASYWFLVWTSCIKWYFRKTKDDTSSIKNFTSILKEHSRRQETVSKVKLLHDIKCFIAWIRTEFNRFLLWTSSISILLEW